MRDIILTSHIDPHYTHLAVFHGAHPGAADALSGLKSPSNCQLAVKGTPGRAAVPGLRSAGAADAQALHLCAPEPEAHSGPQAWRRRRRALGLAVAGVVDGPRVCS